MGLIGMTSENYRLRDELDEGLRKYGEDNNLSPISIIEDLVEDFLCRKDYLQFQAEPTHSEREKIKHAYWRKDNCSYQIAREINRIKYTFGHTKSSVVAKEIISFLNRVNWDVKYSVKNTGLKGDEQINFLLNEIEKEKENEQIEDAKNK